MSGQPNSVLQQKMGRIPSRSDPIPKSDKDLLSADTSKIKHDGGLYSDETFCIVAKYATEQERQARWNSENGNGAITNTEVAKIATQEYIYNHDSFYDYDDPFEDWMLNPPVEHEIIYKQDALGETYGDNGLSCKYKPLNLGSSVPEIYDFGDTPTEETTLEQDANPVYDFAEIPQESQAPITENQSNTLSGSFAQVASPTPANTEEDSMDIRPVTPAVSAPVYQAPALSA